ncbi:hypothetical protein OGH69_10300 [Flavobacterium sp. MFBS3-15]|uniref:hypothetical protein n=1 Tax=Flavobacterium sp. MFBS3-15 TaxID=2989816 RepID=UPI0022357691|nr:hypothetical protein [Flavobacterium sp. MFBS3-15]MCW4469356.1 hypothetical protein [Flavobacterium sp. MFBS3-15]
MTRRLLYPMLFFAAAAVAQDRQLLHGKVLIGDDPGAALFVINNKTGTETKTGNDGTFSLLAKEGDALAVYSDRTDVREFDITANSFKENPYVMSVNYKAYELEGVEIDKYKNVNSESLGLVRKGSKKDTPAERKLKTAGEFKPVMLLGLIAGGMPVDPIINAITGRTKMLKKALATERKELLIEKIYGLYTEEEIATGFSIPKEYVNGFVFHIVEDADLAAALNAGNTDRVKFLMAGLAAKYLEIIRE